jgi:hypothetical protein
MTATASAIRTAQRVDRFTYAIRNIVVEAKKVEASGKAVRYLNIGDPNQFGFLTPPHLIEAVEKAMRDGHNGYTPSPGIVEAREAAAADFASRGVNVSADRVLITSGTSEGIELALTAIVDEGEEVLVPSPTYPLYTAVLAKIGARPAYYRTDPHGSPRGPFHLCHPQHRRRGAQGGSRRHPRALSEHRRSQSIRVRHAAAFDRSRRTRDARWPQRVHGVGRHRSGA